MYEKSRHAFVLSQVWRTTSYCRFKDAVCYACRKRGHIARVCQDTHHDRGQKSQKANCVEDSETSESSSGDEVYAMFAVRDPATNPIYKEVHINRVPINMELDTVSVITHSTYQEIKESTYMEPLQPTTVRLKTYTGEAIGVLGQVREKVRYGQKNYQLSVLVVEGKGLISWVEIN